MICAPNCVTPTYLKPIHRGYEGVETEGPRFDIENQNPMVDRVETDVLNALKTCIPQVDGIIIGDQMHNDNLGVITDGVRAELCALAFFVSRKRSFSLIPERGLDYIKTLPLNQIVLRHNAHLSHIGKEKQLILNRQNDVQLHSLNRRETRYT